MPDVYQSEQTIPELGAAVQGGATVVIHGPEELDGLLAICELAGQPPEDPMHAVFRAVSQPALNLPGWKQWRERSRVYRSERLPDEEVPVVENLQDALWLARNIWSKQDAREKLSLTMSIADPASSSYPEMTVQTGTAVLAFQNGSVIANLTKGPLQAAYFVLCFALGGGAAPSARAEHLVERLRQRAMREPNVEPLHDVSKLRTQDLAESRALVVFVHGLLSIDVGRFDALIRRLTAEKGENGLLTAGFPHNTLGPIARNARELARALSGAVGERAIPVGLVCHSRGGLVARQAAEYLYQEDAKRTQPVWKDRLRVCVTFGTPHLGAELAEAPSGFMGAFVAEASLHGTRDIASLVDVLAYRQAHDGFPGIEDLCPESKFLKELEEQEKGVSPNVKIVAVGGRATTTGAVGVMTNKLYGTSEHDQVVRLRSSLPDFLDPERRIETQSTHFEYFDEMSQREVLDQISATLREELLERAPAGKTAKAGR